MTDTQNSEEREGEVLQTFQDFRAALFESDVETLDRILAEDYRGYNLRGELEPREVVLEAYSPGGVVLEVFEVDGMTVDVLGDVGIVTGVGRVEGTFAGKPWEHELHFCDIYVMCAGAWRLFISHATPIEG